MPIGIYVRTEKHKSNMSKALKGRIISNETRSNMSKAKLGKTGIESNRYQGGNPTESEGYVWILSPNHPFVKGQHVAEHRLVVEKLIGRYLTTKEQVHHENKIRNDNRPENFIAFSSKSAHMRWHGDPNNVKPEEIIFDGRTNY